MSELVLGMATRRSGCEEIQERQNRCLAPAAVKMSSE